MIPFAIPMALKALPWKLIGLAAGAIAVALAVWWLVDSIGDAREEKVRAEWDAAVRAAEAKAAADTVLLQDAIAEIDTDVAINMEAVNEVRVVYRDKIRTVAIAADRPDCAIVDSLREQINSAAAAYAAAAAGPGGPAVPDAAPAP